jgi:hypothetical protein
MGLYLVGATVAESALDRRGKTKQEKTEGTEADLQAPVQVSVGETN